MKYHQEEPHPGKKPSLRVGERLTSQTGDPIPEKREMEAEQRAAFVPPGTRDPRVEKSEEHQGRSH